MKRSTDRILTTHVGSLPRPDDLMALYAANAPDDKLQPRLRAAVGDIVRRQAETGIDVVNDGEYGKAMRSAMDFGAWWSYVYPRLEGFELREEQAKKGRARLDPRQQGAQGFRRVLRRRSERRRERGPAERLQHRAALRPHLHVAGEVYRPRRHQARHRQPRRGARAAGVEEAFMTAVSPATLQILPNAHYKSAEDYTLALAEAIGEEYRAIVEAGFILQIDDPALVDIYDWWFSMNDDIAGYRKWAAFQVEAVNHALKASRRIACASTSAGEAGTARTAATSSSRTSSTCWSR